MYNLFPPPLLLILPSIAFATPAQPINSLALTTATANPGTSNPIGPEPIDPRFNMQPVYRATPLNEDECLVAAVQFLGLLGSDPFTGPEETRNYFDDRLPHVVITPRSPRTGGTVEARFLVWGLYLGLKDMIESNRFRNVQLVLRWEGQIVAFISINKRAAPPLLSLPGANSTTNSTNILQQRSSSSYPSSTQWNIPTTSTQNTTSFTLLSLLPNTPPSNPGAELSMKIAALPDQPLPKNNIIMALLDGILAVASRTTRAHVPDRIRVQTPAPYGARLLVVPERAVAGRPYLTFGMVALAIRQIPGNLLLGVGRWVEVRFQIEVDDVVVARGALSV